MFLVTITNWKKKFVFLAAFLLLLILVITLIPFFNTNNIVNTDSTPKDEDILNPPIKVQGKNFNQ